MGMNKRPKIGSYVHHSDGRVGRVIAYYPVTVQFGPIGKDRHKHRIEVEIADLQLITEMEVIAEAAR